MNIAFAGTPDFAAAILAAVLEAGHHVAAVYTQPDRPAGRGRKLAPSPVKRLAAEHALPLLQPPDLRGPEHAEQLRRLGVEALVVAAYGLILPKPVLEAPALGCINVHASLLPRWRGAAPIQRAILAGDAVTGVSIMRMDEGLDTGPVYVTRETVIRPRDTAGSLHDRLATLGCEALLDVLDTLPSATLYARPQPDEGATYAARLDKTEARLDWRLDAASLDRRVRAFNPVPMAWTTLAIPDGAVLRLRVLAAQPARLATAGAVPGEILVAAADTLCVACGDGALRLEQVHPAGRKPMTSGQFMRSRPLKAGDRFA